MNPAYHLINKGNAAFWTRVVQATKADVQSLCVFRIIAGLCLLLFYFPSFSWISRSPHAFFNPPVFSIANLVGSFPGACFFITLDILSVVAVVCITIGLKARLATLVYVILSFTGLSFKYSFGKIDHDVLTYVSLGCLAFSGWGSGLAVLPDKPVSKNAIARSLSLAAVFICFAFFTAGFEKALRWVDFNRNTNGLAAWHYSGVYRLGREFLLASFFDRIPFRFLEVFDYSAVLFELTPFLFLLWSRRAWRTWLLLASIFHLLNTLLLNISFIAHLTVYLAFIDYTGFYKKIALVSQKRSYRILFFSFIALLVCLRLRISLHYTLAANILIPDKYLEPNLYLAVIL